MRDKEFEVWDVAVNEVYGLWHVDGTGLLTQSADGDGFLCYTWILEHEVAQRLAQSCTKFFLMWMVVSEGTQSSKCGTLQLMKFMVYGTRMARVCLRKALMVTDFGAQRITEFFLKWMMLSEGHRGVALNGNTNGS